MFRRFISQNPWLVPLVSRVHRVIYRGSGGRVGVNAGGTKLLLLTTTGRKSGLPRVTPLLYIEDADRWVVVASNGGTEKIPSWWFNLQSRPEASIQTGREHHAVRASEATPEETQKLWPKLNTSYEFFTDYQERTQREIPVVIFDRR